MYTYPDSYISFSRLYNLSSLSPELAASLLTMEPAAQQQQQQPQIASPNAELFPGWSLSRTGLQMTVAGGAIPIFTLEQIGECVSSVTAVRSDCINDNTYLDAR